MNCPRAIQNQTLSLSVLLSLVSALPDDDKPLIPFILLYYLAEYGWENFLRQAIIMDGAKDLSGEALTTSCVNTAHAAALIFFGEASAKKMFYKMNTPIKFNFSIHSPSGNVWDYSILNLFGGDYIRALNQNEKNPSYEFLQSYDEYCNSFFKQCDPTSKEEDILLKFQQFLTLNQYQFNQSTLTVLKNEIENNVSLTNSSTSHVYYVTTVSSEDDIVDTTAHDHSFVLEQFYLAQSNEVRYRIYQSWILQASLAEEFKKREYGVYGENALTHEQVKTFLSKLTELYHNPGRKPNKMTSRQCFGYFSNPAYPTIYDDKTKTLSGLNVRYLSRAINPNDCVKNLTEFTQSAGVALK